jgi:hypothetical protein
MSGYKPWFSVTTINWVLPVLQRALQKLWIFLVHEFPVMNQFNGTRLPSCYRWVANF